MYYAPFTDSIWRMNDAGIFEGPAVNGDAALSRPWSKLELRSLEAGKHLARSKAGKQSLSRDLRLILRRREAAAAV